MFTYIYCSYKEKREKGRERLVLYTAVVRINLADHADLHTSLVGHVAYVHLHGGELLLNEERWPRVSENNTNTFSFRNMYLKFSLFCFRILLPRTNVFPCSCVSANSSETFPAGLFDDICVKILFL